MPYKSEQIPIAGTKLDRRRKLLPEAIEVIKTLKAQGWSYRQLAKMFHCSKRRIQNIITPEQRKPSQPKPTEEATAIKREYRQRKQALYVAGKLKPKKSEDNG